LRRRLLPDLASLRTRFAPDPASLPDIHVPTVPLAVYQDLLDTPVLKPVLAQEYAADAVDRRRPAEPYPQRAPAACDEPVET